MSSQSHSRFSQPISSQPISSRPSPNHPSMRRLLSPNELVRTGGSQKPDGVDGRGAGPSGRALHLVDVDNLLGDPRTTDPTCVHLLFDDYRRVAQFREGDHVVIATGCSPKHVFVVEAAWPTACHRRRAGADGADMALLEEADWAASSRRYDRVVIGSGDRIFLDALDRLRAVDLNVDVVARARSLARAFAIRALGHVHLLPEAPMLAPA